MPGLERCQGARQHEETALSIRVAALAVLLCGAACVPRYHLDRRELTASDGLSCEGYVASKAENTSDVFIVINGSGSASNAFVHPSFESLLSSRPIAYVTWDKPGVHATFGDPARVRRDGALERYTLGHGVACAKQALHWARERFGETAWIHLRGHSEGAWIALKVYDELLTNEPALAGAIASLVLSGVPLEPFDVILERQFASIPGLTDAYQRCDWAALERKTGASCAWVADAKQRPSGRVLFERLAERGARAGLHVFHGTEDWNTPVAPVRALEAWASADGRLAMLFHFYAGGHSGNDEAKARLQEVLRALLSER